MICLLDTASFAVTMPNLYRAVVPVITQTSEMKEQAIKEGFLQVLEKVSGNPDIEENPVIRANLKRAEYYVHEYSYSPVTTDSAQYLLQIQFERNDINRLLNKANVAYWGENRPLILIWLAMTDEQDHTTIIINEDPGKIYADIKQESSKYGLPVIFPMMDLDEISHVLPTDITDLSLEVLKKAGGRYAPDAMLVGEIVEGSRGLQSRWHLLLDNTQWTWKIDGKTSDELIASVIAKVNHAIMQLYVRGAVNEAVNQAN